MIRAFSALLTVIALAGLIVVIGLLVAPDHIGAAIVTGDW